MSWKTDKAMKIILNVFKQKKTPVTAFEVEALKSLSSELENSLKSNVNDDFLFLKMFTILLKEYLKTYKDINFAKNQVLRELSHPLGYHVEEIESWLNTLDTINYFKSIGLDFESNHEKEYEKTILNENQQDILNKLKGVWSYEKIEKSLYNTANDMLKDINYYK